MKISGLVLLSFIFFLSSINAQQINLGEYFVDADPGVGNGTAISFNPDDSVDVNFALPTNNLSTGFHTLNVRFRNTAGVWSHSEGRLFFVNQIYTQQEETLMAGEYFIDSDPGVGNASSFSVVSGDSVSSVLSIPTNTLSSGFHTLNIRYKNQFGIWSLSEGRVFYVNPILSSTNQQILAAEYYIDTDPGVGNATSISVSVGDSVTSILALPTNSLSAGFHTLNIRYKDQLGKWSLSEGRVFYVYPSAPDLNDQIVAAEYFINNDPGVGNGFELPVVEGDSIDVNFELNSSSLPLGNYTSVVRVKNATGVWSINEARGFSVCENPPPVIELQYSVNNDSIFVEPTISGGVFPNTVWNVNGQSIPFAGNLSFALDVGNNYEVCLIVSRTCNAVVISDSSCFNFDYSFALLPPNDLALNPGDSLIMDLVSPESLFSPENQFVLEVFQDGDAQLSSPILTKNFSVQTLNEVDLFFPVNFPSGCYFFRISSTQPELTSISSFYISIGNIVEESSSNMALYFDGEDDYASLGNWFNETGFSISFWVKPSEIQTGTATIMDIQNDLGIYNNPAVTNNYVLAHLLQFDLIPNEWQHVTLTHQGNLRKVYLFGQLIAENNWSYNPVNGREFTIGKGISFYNGKWKGYIDDLKIFNTALSDQEVASNVYTPIYLGEPNVIASYNFNEPCNLSTFVDRSGNNHLGSLFNGVLKVPSTVPSQGNEVIPNYGGNNGFITIQVFHADIRAGATLKLQDETLGVDLTADTTFISNDSLWCKGRFNLQGSPLGFVNVVIDNVDGEDAFITDGFEIVESVSPLKKYSWQVIGRNLLRPQRVAKILITYENLTTNDIFAPSLVLLSLDNRPIGLSREDLNINYNALTISLANNGNNNDTILSPGAIYTIPFYINPDMLVRSSNDLDLNRFLLTPIEDIANLYENDQEFAEVANSTNFINGCSAPGGIFNPFNSIFESACNAHDVCYSLCYPSPISPDYIKSYCDKKFYNKMVVDGFDDALNSFPTNIVKNAQKNLIMANIYYEGVSLFGGSYFEAAQENCLDLQDFEPFDEDLPEVEFATVILPNSEEFNVNIINSYDPNSKEGPYPFQNGSEELNYTIYFENVDSATAAAQVITIVDTLSVELDLNTFAFGVFGINDTVFSPPIGLKKGFEQSYDVLPESSILMRVNCSLDTSNRVVYFSLSTIDRSTLYLTEDPIVGILPPNVNSPEGEGFFTFSVKPKLQTNSGTQISNKANIYFDLNPPIQTNVYDLIIDKIAPESNFLSLFEIQNDTTIKFQINSSDDAAGVHYIELYASENNLPYETIGMISGSVDTFLFVGSLNSSYRFYSVAIDYAGNREQSNTDGDINVQLVSQAELSNRVKEIQISPNPSQGIATLEFANLQTNFTIEVYSSSGIKLFHEIVSSNASDKFQLNLRDFADGLYVVKVSAMNWTEIVKLVISH